MSKETKKAYSPVYKKSAAKSAGGNKKVARSHEEFALFKKRFITLGAIALALALVITLSLVFATYQPPYYSEISNTPEEGLASTGTIINGDFQVTLNSGKGSMYPYYAKDWTNTKQKPTETVGGVVSTADDEKEKVRKDLTSVGVPQNLVDNTIFGDKLVDDNRVVLDDDRYEDADYKENVMMLYNRTSSNQKAISTSFTMWGGDYKHIRVWVKTDAVAKAYIALKLGPTTTSSEMSFSGINTNNKWAPYDIYLEADPSWSKTFYLEIGLGEKDSEETGIALFALAEMDNLRKAEYIAMDKVSKGEFSEGAVLPVDRDIYGDLKGKTITGELVNDNGKSQLPRSKKIKSYDEQKTEDAENKFGKNNYFMNETGVGAAGVKKLSASSNEFKEDYKVDYPFFDEDSDVYIIENSHTSETKSRNFTMDKLTIKPSTASTYYRVSFWIKTQSIRLEQGAYIYMNAYRLDAAGNREAVDTDKSANFSKIITNRTSGDTTLPVNEKDKNSGWTSVVFYIKPSNTDTYELELVISLGKVKPLISDTATGGKVFTTEFELFEISKSDYSAASSGDKVTTMDLEYTASSGSVSNGYFNVPVSNATSESNIGLSPSGWTMRWQQTPDSKKGDRKYYEDVRFGILPKGSQNNSKWFLPKNDAAFTNTIFGLPSNENVFGMRLDADGAFAIRSNTFTLSQKATTLVSLLVYTDNQYWRDVKVSLKGAGTGDDEQIDMSYDFSKDVSPNNVDFKTAPLTSFDSQAGIKEGYSGWVKLNFFVTTGENAKEAYLEIALGTSSNAASKNAYLVVDAVRTDTVNETNYDKIAVSQEDKADKTGFVFVKKDKLDGEDVIEVLLETEFSNYRGKDFTVQDEPEEDQPCEECGEYPCVCDAKEYESPETPKEPVKWEYISGIILGAIILFTLVIVMLRRFKFFRKRETVEIEDDQYKR